MDDVADVRADKGEIGAGVEAHMSVEEVLGELSDT